MSPKTTLKSAACTAGFLAMLVWGGTAWGGGGCLEIRNGYFWDPLTADYFVPRGMAYQTWNPPVGADQTLEQLEYDLIEFKKMYANSVRCEMVWNQVEPGEGEFDFRKPDFLVGKAQELGLKLFVLIGFQYAPSWFTNHSDRLAINSQGEVSVVLNYEHPGSRLAYSNYITRVTERYRNSTAIGAWILGNEYAYFDLWNTNHLYLGFDPVSQASFRRFVATQYGGDIGALNAVWGTAYTRFDDVQMPRKYPSDRDDPAYHDLTKWREYSIGEYVAVGAVAAKSADPNHLRTYSMIGGLYIGDDAFYTCEDAKTIVARCVAAGAPLDFWAINNYAWATFTKELRSGDFGITKHQAQSGLPVLVSETGHSSTDSAFPDASPRQGEAVPTQMWEALISGAIGTHIFTWNDRDMFGGDYFIRERGFGVVSQTRFPKVTAYTNVQTMFRRMEDLKVDRLLGGSVNPPADIHLFWGDAAKMGWPRANQENAFLWNALKRLGYQPAILDDEQFERGDYTNAAALALSRCYQMKPEHLDRVVSDVITRGIRVHANVDLPGQFDTYHRPNAAWPNAMDALFGLNVSRAVPGWDTGVENTVMTRLDLTVTQPLGPLTNGYRNSVWTWKIWHGITGRSGTTIATHRGYQSSQAPLPALYLKDSGNTKTAVNTFALADLEAQSTLPPTHDWDFRYDWLRAIYRDGFGMVPLVDLTGPGAQYVIPDYRHCTNGSTLISLLNTTTNSATVTLTAPALLDGKAVEDLTAGGLLATNSSGVVSLTLKGDGYALLYAYTRSSAVDASLVNPDPSKVWLESAPGAVWPREPGYEVTVGYDVVTNLDLLVRFERSASPRQIYAQSAVVPVSGRGTATVTLHIPDADPGDRNYVSSKDGGAYVFRARLERGRERVAEATLPVRLLWGVRPLSVPQTVSPGARYDVPLEWEELPSYEASEDFLPLNRAAMWQPYLATSQYYDVVLELRDAHDAAVASDHFLTNQGSGTNVFSLTVPPNATGPFRWLAYLRPAPGACHAMRDGFEGRTPGSVQDEWLYDPNARSPIWPWVSYNYPYPDGAQQWWDEGVGTNYSEGSWGAFLVITNPPPPLGYSGFGIGYNFPETWALPSDIQQWTNYTFSCDVMDTFGNDSLLELQVKDDLGGGITFTKPYLPGPGGWDTIQAPLTQFQVMTNYPATGYFNQARVQSLVANVQMQDPNATYAANFDRIRFEAPVQAAPATTSNDVRDSFEDRPHGDKREYLLPWNPYAFAEDNNAVNVSNGVQPLASDGFRSAFVLTQNPTNPGGWSGFGMYREFPEAWSLPAETNAWTNYVFSYDFREANGYQCVLELQVKSASNHWVSFFKPYTPGPNGWDTIHASLDEFKVPEGSQGFDSHHVQTLAVNVSMEVKNVLYFASFDNIRFDGPDTPLPPDLRYGTFRRPVEFPRDSDADGVQDNYETGTGVYGSPTDTGTRPDRADTDADGLSDGQELIAGTDPNSASDVLQLEHVQRLSRTEVELGWHARPDRLYTVYGANELGADPFVPVPGLLNLSTDAPGWMSVVDSAPDPPARRFYRIGVEQLPE